ncbi:MAG TPA: SCP2 sterol-binding domain-containing protein [Solirubrobacteraceae bacterium]|nr:SCP2 sterol-binding domain-containing protein [Solirubrobacteraceae bacterium]
MSALSVLLPLGLRRRFNPEAAGELAATFELRISEARFAVRVADGTCRVERRPAPEAAARVSISERDLVRLVTGAAEWTRLLAEERLRLEGDPFLALRFPQLFGLRAWR